MGSYSTALDCGDYLTDSQFTKFDITELVKGWKNNTYSAQAGFILINDDETAYKQMFSCEHTATNCRPYVTMEYRTDFFLDKMTASVLEGGTVTITASSTPSGQPVTWSTSNSAVATVSASGVVTAKKAGTVTITATLTDVDGTTQTADCTVYVRIADGVYFFKNQYSNYYMTVTNGRISSGSDVCQYYKAADSADVIYRLRQMWRIHYLGSGRYSIRPMHKLDMGLDVTDGIVDIYSIGTTDTLSGVADYAEWTIEWGTIGYIFKQRGDSSRTAQIENASQSVNAAVVASDYSSSYSCQWVATKIASPPSGVYLYDTGSNTRVSTATKSVDVGVPASLSTLQLNAVAFSETTISQSFTWSSNNTSVATVDSNGTVTGLSIGTATITGRAYRNSTYYYISYIINVSALLVYQTDRTYYYDASGNYAEDLVYADLTEAELRALEWVNWTDFVDYTAANHRAAWEDMCTLLFAREDMDDVILDMIDHFMGGSGSVYSNSVLTQEAYEHDSTQAYIESIEGQMDMLLSEYEGNISTWEYTADDRESNPIVIAFEERGINRPKYNTENNRLNGLQICVNDLWGIKIEITSYSINGNNYSYTLHYTLYDHFGLDQPDVETYGYLSGFRSWYVLQHFSEYNSAYKPYLTLIEFDETVSGTLS